MESERSDALFHDPYARRLGGERGQAIVDAMPRGKSMSWPMVVRTAVMDEIVLRCVQQGARTVLNLAAGLDARPYRLPLPPTLRWLHVDLPDMVDYFRERMAGETPRCELEFIAADLRDADARDATCSPSAAAHGPVLVDHRRPAGLPRTRPGRRTSRATCTTSRTRSWWLTDLASPMLLKFLEKQWPPKLKQGNAPFRFGPAEGTAFFEPYGWREAEFRSTWDESMRLKRTMPGAWLWKLLSNVPVGAEARSRPPHVRHRAAGVASA